MADGWLESPVPALSLLHLFADLCGLNKQILTDKFQKLHMQEAEIDRGKTLHAVNESGAVFDINQEAPVSPASGNLKSSILSETEREERYRKFLTEKPPKEQGFAIKAVTENVRNLRRDEDPARLADLERERKAFVDHLFKKKS